MQLWWKGPPKQQLRTAEQKLRELETAQRELRAKQTKDYGPEDRLLSLAAECFQSTPIGGYVYELCPLDKAKQGHTVSIGAQCWVLGAHGWVLGAHGWVLGAHGWVCRCLVDGKIGVEITPR